MALRRLSRRGTFEVLALVAQNPSTPAGVLARLAGEHGPEIAFLVAANPSARPSTLRDLFSRNIPGIESRVVGNRSCPPELWRDVLTRGRSAAHESALVGLVERHGFPVDMFPLAATHGSRRLRAAVAASPLAAPTLLDHLACTDTDREVLASVAANPHTPTDTAVIAALRAG